MYTFIRLFFIFGTVLFVSLHATAQTVDCEIRENISYKIINGQDLKLDIYRLDSLGAPKPVIVYLHGGVWLFGDKSNVVKGDRVNVLNQLVQNGFAVVSINYRLIDADSTHFPAPMEDCKDAIRWIKINADKYNLNVENIGIWGHSAGAHLAMLTAFSSDDTRISSLEPQEHSSHVNYVIDFYGGTDLNTLFKLHVSKTSDFLLKILKRKRYRIRQSILFKLTGLDPKYKKDSVAIMCAVYSPLSYVNKSTVPVLMIHGKHDDVVPLGQSELLRCALTEHGVYNKLLVFKNESHVFYPLKKENTEITIQIILDFLQAIGASKAK